MSRFCMLCTSSFRAKERRAGQAEQPLCPWTSSGWSVCWRFLAVLLHSPWASPEERGVEKQWWLPVDSITRVPAATTGFSRQFLLSPMPVHFLNGWGVSELSKVNPALGKPAICDILVVFFMHLSRSFFTVWNFRSYGCARSKPAYRKP